MGQERTGVRTTALPLAPGTHCLSLLGAFQLTRSGTPVAVTAREQRLLAFLALHGPRPRALVAGMLWPESPDSRARAAVRATVWSLARRLPGLLAPTPREVALAPDVVVDVDGFLAAARQVQSVAGGAQALALAADLGPGGRYAGHLLPGWYDDWALTEAERLQQLRLHALDRLVPVLVDAGLLGEALELALAAVAEDPLRESAQRTLMRVHLAEGNAAEALRRYERFRDRLVEALGIEPSPWMTSLVAEIVGRTRPVVIDLTAAPAPAPLSPM